MVEQKLFEKSKETNCDIMFLVRRKELNENGEPTGIEKLRMMSFKSNPWLGLRDEPSKADPDIVKQSLFLFSGKLDQVPGDDEIKENRKKNCRRFNNDKIQCT